MLLKFNNFHGRITQLVRVLVLHTKSSRFESWCAYLNLVLCIDDAEVEEDEDVKKILISFFKENKVTEFVILPKPS